MEKPLPGTSDSEMGKSEVSQVTSQVKSSATRKNLNSSQVISHEKFFQVKSSQVIEKNPKSSQVNSHEKNFQVKSSQVRGFLKSSQVKSNQVSSHFRQIHFSY